MCWKFFEALCFPSIIALFSTQRYIKRRSIDQDAKILDRVNSLTPIATAPCIALRIPLGMTAKPTQPWSRQARAYTLLNLTQAFLGHNWRIRDQNCFRPRIVVWRCLVLALATQVSVETGPQSLCSAINVQIENHQRPRERQHKMWSKCLNSCDWQFKRLWLQRSQRESCKRRGASAIRLTSHTISSVICTRVIHGAHSKSHTKCSTPCRHIWIYIQGFWISCECLGKNRGQWKKVLHPTLITSPPLRVRGQPERLRDVALVSPCRKFPFALPFSMCKTDSADPEIGYAVKYVERHGRTFPKDPHSIRETGVYHKLDAGSETHNWLLLQPSTTTRLGVERLCSQLSELRQFQVHAAILLGASENWRYYINYFEKEFSKLVSNENLAVRTSLMANRSILVSSPSRKVPFMMAILMLISRTSKTCRFWQTRFIRYHRSLV